MSKKKTRKDEATNAAPPVGVEVPNSVMPKGVEHPRKNDIPSERRLEYIIADGGKRCPYCKSGNILFDGKPIQKVRGEIEITCVCVACRKTWRDLYYLIDAIGGTDEEEGKGKGSATSSLRLWPGQRG
jgi:hypothetical protein